jgi:hypothetical protein
VGCFGARHDWIKHPTAAQHGANGRNDVARFVVLEQVSIAPRLHGGQDECVVGKGGEEQYAWRVGLRFDFAADVQAAAIWQSHVEQHHIWAVLAHG